MTGHPGNLFTADTERFFRFLSVDESAHHILTVLFIFPALTGKAGRGCASVLSFHLSCLPGKACHVSLSLKNIVVKAEGQTLIYDTSVDLAVSGFNILLGTTLAGKTTLMQVMAGLLKPAEGEIWFKGQNVTGMPVQKRNVSMVYQQFINYPNMTVFENIASPLRVVKTPTKVIRERVGPVAEMLKLSPFLDRKPSELSGGQQQRCAMARALVKDSDLVLLDEPLANLDYKLREELRDELPRIFADRDCTVVYATTEPSEALLLAGHTAAMQEGRIAQFGPTSEVYRQPINLATAQVFSEPPMNTVAVTKAGGFLVLEDQLRWPISGAIAGLADGAYVLGLRAHHVVVAAGGSSDAQVQGAVQVTEISGSESTVHFSMNAENWVSQSHRVHQFDAGQAVAFNLDLNHALLFTPDGALAHA
ncbi:MAG: ABC transporter ATP-binding protein [Burkholderiaceae bacterium]